MEAFAYLEEVGASNCFNNGLFGNGIMYGEQ